MATIVVPQQTALVANADTPYRTILRLATPTVLAMVSQSVVNEIDIVFFAHLPQPESSNAQAGLLPSLILLWIFGGSLSAISVGTQAYAARRHAEGKPADAGAVLVNAVAFTVVAGILATLIGRLVIPALLARSLAPPAAAAAIAYIDWRIFGVMSMATTFAYKAFFDAIGKTHVHLVGSIVMNAVNITMCWMFIFGNAGAPRMGAAGAGLAGFACTWIGLAIMVGYAALPEFRSFRPFDFSRVSGKTIVDVLKLSVPSAVATVAVMTGFALFCYIVSVLDRRMGHGAEPINAAATTDVIGVLKLTFTACLGFGTSTATLVSQSLGAREPEKAAKFGWASVRLGLVVFGIVGLLEGVVLTDAILSFVTHSAAVHQAALLPMRTMGILTPLIAVGMILTQALFGAGNSRFVMIAELVLHFTCLVPLAWVLGITLGFGLPGIWAAAVVYVVVLASLMIWKFWFGDWKKIQL